MQLKRNGFMLQIILGFALLISALASQAMAEEALGFVIAPYLQYPTQNSIIIRWETNAPATSVVEFGKSAQCESKQTNERPAQIHEVKLEGLKEASNYFYRVSSTAGEESLESEIYTFQTAVGEKDPFSFTVICDTQDFGKIVKQLSTAMWGQRPHFYLHGGDLVSEGPVKKLWVDHFFKNTAELNARVACIPTLGNHERDAQNYYDYFSLPSPEYYYAFRYGNLEVFCLDSERSLAPKSEQYLWLEKSLAVSKATWKIVLVHCPAYSSDENDYGDTTERRPFWGDMRMRRVLDLYDQYQVDIVWSGHIHSYERTYPIKDKQVVEEGGTVYLITGGGGGHLEKAGPFKSPFTAKVKRTFQYCYVTVNGKSLRMEAYDNENHCFDWMELKK